MMSVQTGRRWDRLIAEAGRATPGLCWRSDAAHVGVKELEALAAVMPPTGALPRPAHVIGAVAALRLRPATANAAAGGVRVIRTLRAGAAAAAFAVAAHHAIEQLQRAACRLSCGAVVIGRSRSRRSHRRPASTAPFADDLEDALEAVPSTLPFTASGPRTGSPPASWCARCCRAVRSPNPWCRAPTSGSPHYRRAR